MKRPLGWLMTPSFADRQQPGQMYHGPNPSSGDEGKDSERSSKPSGETEPFTRWRAKANVTDHSSPFAGKPVCLRWNSIAGCSFIECRFWQCCSKCNRTHRAFHCTQLPAAGGTKGQCTTSGLHSYHSINPCTVAEGTGSSPRQVFGTVSAWGHHPGISDWLRQGAQVQAITWQYAVIKTSQKY